MSGLASIRQAGPLITTLVGAHVALSAASLVRAGIGGLPNNNKTKGGTGNKAGKGAIIAAEECFDAKHYDLLTDFVARMYRGSGFKSSSKLDGGRTLADITGVKLAPSVTFEDPAAICVGEEEIREAFRAMQYLDPVSLSPPICIDVKPRGDSIDLTFQLNQQYTVPRVQYQLSLISILTVTVQLQQMQDVGLPESEFLITKMKELWYGNPLMWPYRLFYIPRRLNGIISYHLSSRLL